MPHSVTVAIVTINRPHFVEKCLKALLDELDTPDELFLVDASPNEETALVASKYSSHVTYIKCDKIGPGFMTHQRNLAISRSTCDIVAFVDDDAVPHKDWLKNLRICYEQHPEAGGVGGRAIRLTEALPTEIGALTQDGNIIGNFDSTLISTKPFNVEHIIGCNMSFKRDLLVKIGGFCNGFVGTSLREETDVCQRIKKLGHKLYFDPILTVDHLAAPSPIGKRFDLRYQHFAIRNHILFLMRSYGKTDIRPYKYALAELTQVVKSSLAGIVKIPICVGSIISGLIAGSRNERERSYLTKP